MFDVAEDPNEVRNIYGTPAASRVLPELSKTLAGLQADAGLPPTPE